MKKINKFWNWLKWDAKYAHKTVWRGLKNIIQWMPIVWKDRDWDHYYILDALRFKLKRTADYIEKHKRHMHYEDDVRRIRTCQRLLDNILEDKYELEYFDYYDFNIRFEPVKGKEGFSSLETDVIRDDSEEYLKKYPTYHRYLTDKVKERDTHYQALMLGQYRHKRATELLFKIINRHIYEWWD